MEREIYKLYNDTITLEFEPQKHTYYVNGKVVYGVSSISDILDKPALINWAVNKALDYLRSIWKAGESYDELEINNFLETAKNVHGDKSNQAKTIGKMVHEWIEKYIKSKISNTPLPELPINEQLKNSVSAFLEWEKANNIEWKESEKKIYSKKYEYAGTLDAEALVNGELAIIDFKTSNGIFDSYMLQVSAYLNARKEETGQDYKKCFIVRIGKDGELEIREVKIEDVERSFKAFLGCLEVYKWKMDNITNKEAKEPILEEKINKALDSAVEPVMEIDREVEMMDRDDEWEELEEGEIIIN